MAAAGLSKAEYLQRYLSGPAGPAPARPRRRRTKRPPGGAGRAGMRIVDDDVSWSSIAAAQENEEEEDEGDMPVVAEFIDERPDAVKLMEEFRRNAKWKLLGDQGEDTQSSDVSAPAQPAARRQHHDTPDPSPPRRQRHDTPDPSPPRRQRHDTPDPSPPRRQRRDTPDPSPPRRQRHDTPDPSPPRRQRHDTPDPSPPRRQRHDTPDPSRLRQQRHDTPDPSPPRRQRHDTPDLSPPRRLRHDTPDPSPPRRQRHDTPDPLPPRRQRHDTPDPSPPRRQRRDTPDLSPRRLSPVPGRRGCKTSAKPLLGRAQGERSPPGRGVSDKSSSRHKRSVTPDLSPPRKKRHDSDSDLSPPRRKRSGSPSLKKPSRAREASPATKRLREVPSPQRKEQHRSRSPRDVSPHRQRDAQGSPKKANAAFSAVRAGLVSAEVLQREQQELRSQESSTRLLAEESRHSKTIYRDKSGRKRDLEREWLEQRQKAEASSERDEQYARWGKGLAQERQQQQNVEDAIKEMQKPLARYIDDQDLDRMLREQEREGDPMAALIKKRKARAGKEKKEKPRYNGPAPPLNRFNIWPGHRWDGVDRSNGFEQQRFARMADKRAVQELAYKWSVEDM
ncbi:BUD13 homolog isoform X2 [Columba livia]|uniref:BUD13 homolog isoform X2 n=1 Tax=Columba livia TaxID=8932 RepID=UPI0031B9C612